MNCIKDGKYTGDSCLGCPVGVDKCEIRDKVYRKRWIPVKERLPEQREDVIVTVAKLGVTVAWYSEVTEVWKNANTDKEIPGVTAWMPLPEPFTQQN